MKIKQLLNSQTRWKKAVMLTLALVFALLLGAYQVASATPAEVPAAQPSTFHPTFLLLDANGDNVLESGKPVSTMQTCGSCHDADFIASHSFHADVGLSQFGSGGDQPWDSSPGLFGNWDPITYRYLSPVGSDRVDLTTPEWLMTLGLRHVGGGPAVMSREGRPLTSLTPSADNPQTSIIDPESGQLVAWDWNESGTVEMNCFLCHLENPNNEARMEALQAGNFAWANTLTLVGTGLLDQVDGELVWNEAAFNEDGTLARDFVMVQDPTNENCGSCHGTVHMDLAEPFTLGAYGISDWSSMTTGQVMSPQKLSQTGLNLEDKEALARSWDIHVERVLACTDCHYALNNPIYYQEGEETRPDHLNFDPRRIDLGEYLYRPLHQFAKGSSTQSDVAPELDDTLRRCESCHNVETTHNWLPYKDRHTTAVSCESCHIPELYAPALESVDWTVLTAEGTARLDYRGIEGAFAPDALVSGYEPVLLTKENRDGSYQLAPFNLITAWYWVAGTPEQPVALRDLQAAYFDGDTYAPEVLAAFDADGNGRLEEAELRIDTDEKEALIAGRLAALGLENAHIVGEIRPYAINHNVTAGKYATRDCTVCHGEQSRVTASIPLATYTPGGVMPAFSPEDEVTYGGQIITKEDGTLLYQPQTSSSGLYVLGHDSVGWVDWAGIIIFLGVFAGVIGHGGLRYLAARRLAGRAHQPQIKEVYMYTVYERLWHWLQTVVIFGLLFTGLIIHKPDKFGIFTFNYVVQVHNVLAAILLINAALAAFYHLASGEIKQFLPQPRGFFNQMIEQATYYVRGIFRGEEHPFEKRPDRKLNPLQQVTYFGLLNILLPLQVITGILMWGVQRWPETAAYLGGLPGLAPFHTLIAWLFASFIVMHVYLTTTGHTPLANIRAMIMGWDEVEVHGEGAASAAD
jgi:thiosulfate reductase cytochrome b subunit